MKSCDNGERTQRPFICVMPKAHINTCITLQSGSLQLHKRTFIYDGGNLKGSFAFCKCERTLNFLSFVRTYRGRKRYDTQRAKAI